MVKVSFCSLLLLMALCACSQLPIENWPVLKHYDQHHLRSIALPLGGIGTGTVSLGGRGELRDWQIMNTPGIGYNTVTKGNDAPFFAIYVQKDTKRYTRALIGPLDESEYQHYEGRPVNHHGLPRFSEASFDAAYPFGQVNLSDKNMPVRVRIKGFNPLIPGDAANSGIPIAVLSYEVTNRSDQPLQVSVCGSLRNFIGKDGSKYKRDWKGDVVPYGAKNNRNKFRKTDKLAGIYFYSDSVDPKDAAWGTMALTTDAAPSGPVDPGTNTIPLISYRTSSRSNDWAGSMLDFWDDFSSDGELTEKTESIDDDPMASLAVKKLIPPGQTRVFTFYLTWNFPNRYAWPNPFSEEKKEEEKKDWIGNYYSTQYTDAWEVATKTVPRLQELQQSTLQFVNAFLSGTYPEVIKEAALFNLATLRSQTVFRIPSGQLMGWEGIFDEAGSCFGSCTHVWNYEEATPFLFGELSRTMRDIEFNHSTLDNGKMKFRTSLPLSKPQTWWGAAADGQLGTVMKFYRDWQLSGNNDFLQQNWPQVKKALSYAWIKGGWDGNQDGVMEGSQHNTMDINYFGPNPQMGFWYMGALRAAREMALFMKDDVFAVKCKDLYTKGSHWMDQQLFNGEYYEQRITDPVTFQYLDMNDPSVKIPDYQLGKGCLVDQLVGQMMAHICGLGYLGDSNHIRTTLKSIMKYNYLPRFADHFNNMRSYVMGDESGLLMASWPKGRLKIPFPYFNESMTGFEYTAAVGMLYEGQTTNALQCIKSIRNRFDGSKRNPFDEPECGHFYARSMTSWATLLAWTDFRYSGVTKSMCFTAKAGTWFWSNGSAWGTCKVTGEKAILTVLHGQLELNSFSLMGKPAKLLHNFVVREGEKKEIVF
ncbi:GH116 family glycosyl-hydrolase [Flavitalea flava]